MVKLNCGYIGIPLLLWWIAVMMSLSSNNFDDLDNNVILAENRCYYSTKQFIQAKHFIPNIVDFQVNMTLVSNTTCISEIHNIKNYKIWTTVSGIGLPVFGPASILTYPKNSSCVDATSYHGKSITLLVFWVIVLIHVIYLGIKHLIHIKKERDEKRNSLRGLLHHTDMESRRSGDVEMEQDVR